MLSHFFPMHLLSRSWFTVVRKSQGGLRAGVARWLLVLCAMQAAMALLGQMHQIAHAPLPLAVPANGAAVDSGNEKATTGNSWFGAHTAGDCQLFQHHALGWGGLMLAMLVLACSYAPLRNARLGSVLLRQSPALFFARGPPATL